MTQGKQTKWKGVTGHFKRFVLLLGISFTCYRLLFSLFAPNAWHIPDELLLGAMLCVVAYLWYAQAQALSGLSTSKAELRDAHVGTLAALIQAVEAKDPYTRGHSEQVKRLSRELAGKLGLSEERVGVVSRAGMLHDLGKIETPDAVLRKTERLTEEEWQIFRKHPERTATILSTLGFLAEETRVAALHHERCDGTGYCTGLTESDIPIEASIVGVADAFDAMNSDRPYRHKLTREAILEELRKSRGVQYPVAVVDGFLELLAENPELWIRTQTPAPDYT